MPMTNPAARQGHVILRAVLVALSIAVLAVCLLMWWLTVFDTAQPMAAAHPPAAMAASPRG
ncbi:hypothetical protein [Dyella sedimenti]|uniref:hypothetical protein n=1 Tax=Dyella sedimenti TaxID=2919947 RepID=UPI001FAB13A9|nr:hypothetical protein [Dyella sedimenti]